MNTIEPEIQNLPLIHDSLKGARLDSVFSKVLGLPRRVPKEPLGFDIESDQNGDIYLIASENKYLFLDGLPLEARSILAVYFLYQEGFGHVCAFFNIDYDFRGIVKGFIVEKPKEEQNQIRKSKRIVDGEYTIDWIKGKSFKINNPRRDCVWAYDTANFFDGSLESVSQKYLGEGKGELSNEKLDMKHPEKYLPTPKGRKLLRERCMKDAGLAGELLRYLRKLCLDNLEIDPPQYNSEGGLSEYYLIKNVELKHLKPFAIEGFDEWGHNMGKDVHRKLTPKIVEQKALYEQVLEYAYRSYYAGIFYTPWRGPVDFAVELDITSAYPYQMSKLISLSDGEWREAPKGNYSPEACYGFYHAFMRPNGEFPFRLKGEKTIYPKFDSEFLERWVTKDELEYLLETKCPVNMVDGFEFFLDDPEHSVYPFKNAVSKLFTLKNEAEKSGDKGLRLLYKTILNGMYGKTAQNVETPFSEYFKSRVGRLFNPVYSAVITARTRLVLWKRAKKYLDPIYYLATDAACGKPRPDVGIGPVSDELGDFQIKYLEEKDGEPSRRFFTGCILLQNGVITDSNGTFIKTRGFAKLEGKKLIYDKEKGFGVMTTHVMGLAESIRRKSAEKINWFDEKTFRSINPVNDLLIYPKELWENPSLVLTKGFKCEPVDEAFMKSWEIPEKRKAPQTLVASAPSTRRHTP